MTKYLFSPIVKVVLHTKSSKYSFNYEQGNNKTFEIHFNIPFTDSGSPATCHVEIENLSSQHRQLFKVGEQVDIMFGYKYDSVGMLSSGAITAIQHVSSDGTTNTFSFDFREGEQYVKRESSAKKLNDKSKHKLEAASKALGKKKANELYKYKRHNSMSFAKNTSYETIIRRVASDAGIKITSINLPKRKMAKKGYTVHGKPWNTIKSLAKSCGATAYFRRGEVYINDLSKTKGHDEHILISTYSKKGNHGGTGLTAYPTTEDNLNSKKTTWTVVSLLRYQISTGSIVNIKSRTLTGSFRVRSGEHAFDGSAATTTLEVYV